MNNIRISKSDKPVWKKWWLWLIVLIIVIIAVPKGRKNASHPAQSKPVSRVTYENFIKINMGACLDEVNSLLGQGRVSNSYEVDGVRTVIYTWNGPGISNMNVTIQNGIVTSKAQAGLKIMNANITLDKYNIVKEGMAYNQVKSAAGEGQVTSQTKVMNTESIIYSWINNDGSSMDGTFSGGRMIAKSEHNLK